METKNRVRLTIADCEFNVVSEDSEDYIRETAAAVDDSVRTLLASGPAMSTTLAAIMSALDFCDKANKEKEAADNLRGQIKACLDETAELRDKLEAAEAAEKDACDKLKALKTMSGLKALEEQRKTK